MAGPGRFELIAAPYSLSLQDLVAIKAVLRVNGQRLKYRLCAAAPWGRIVPAQRTHGILPRFAQ